MIPFLMFQKNYAQAAIRPFLLTWRWDEIQWLVAVTVDMHIPLVPCTFHWWSINDTNYNYNVSDSGFWSVVFLLRLWGRNFSRMSRSHWKGCARCTVLCSRRFDSVTEHLRLGTYSLFLVGRPISSKHQAPTATNIPL